MPRFYNARLAILLCFGFPAFAGVIHGQTTSGCDDRLAALRILPPAALIDSAWAVRFMSARGASTGGTTAIMIQYRPDGSFESANGVPQLSASARRALEDSVLPHLIVPQLATPMGWSVSLGIGWWGDGELEVLPGTVTCEPVISNRMHIDSALSATRNALRTDKLGRGLEDQAFVYQLGILADGSVRYAQLMSGSGIVAVDSAVTKIVKEMRYSPARLGTEPVRVVRLQSLTLRAVR